MSGGSSTSNGSNSSSSSSSNRNSSSVSGSRSWLTVLQGLSYSPGTAVTSCALAEFPAASAALSLLHSPDQRLCGGLELGNCPINPILFCRTGWCVL